MKDTLIINIITSFLALLAFSAFLWWFTYNPASELIIDIPGRDNKLATLVSTSGQVRIGEYFQTYSGTASDIKGAWPRFRGSNYDNINAEEIALADSWDKNGPELLWTVKLGEGHAGPAVLNGRVYIMDYDETLKSDTLRCFSLDDGEEIWRRWYRVDIKRNHGMSRTIPAVNGAYVVTIGPKGQVMCVAADSGDFKWGLDLMHEYNTEIPQWYTAQCPLIDDNIVIIAPAGDALIIGVDLATGEVVWETPNPKHFKMSHSSIMPMTLNGKKMYVYCALGGVVGISAEKDSQGTILWQTDEWDNDVVAPSPVIFADGRIFLTAGYGAGSMMLKIEYLHGSFSVNSLYNYRPNQEKLACEQQTPLLYMGHLFGIMPKDGKGLRNQFICFDPDTREVIWASGKNNLFGLGPYLMADNKFFILDDKGVLTMIRVSLQKFELLGRSQIIDGVDSWAPLALVEGRMLLRDSTKLVCIDLRDK